MRDGLIYREILFPICEQGSFLNFCRSVDETESMIMISPISPLIPLKLFE